MEELGTFVVNNGLGVASFLVLIYFMINYITKINETLGKISETLVSVENTLTALIERVESLEKTKKGK